MSRDESLRTFNYLSGKVVSLLCVFTRVQELYQRLQHSSFYG